MTDFLLGAAILVIVALLFLLWRLTRQIKSQNQTTRALEARVILLERDRDVLDEQLKAFTRATSDGIVQVDTNGYVIYMNDTARSLLEAANGLEKPLREVGWGYDLQRLVSQVLSEGGESVSQTLVKGERAFSVRAVAIGNQGERGALVGIAEVTELQRLGRVRREFVANISHELRTPVTSLQLLADTINEDVLNN